MVKICGGNQCTSYSFFTSTMFIKLIWNLSFFFSFFLHATLLLIMHLGAFKSESYEKLTFIFEKLIPSPESCIVRK